MSEYGEQLNWEDSYESAAKHLGVSEEQWQAFIAGINDIKTRAQAWSDQGGNQARVMQDRSTPNAMRDRRVAVLLSQNPDMTQEEAIAQVEASSAYQDLSSNIQAYDALNAELNDLYASVGLDPTGALQGSGTNAPGYAVNFDFNSGELSHSKGDVAHDVGKATVAGIGGAMLGQGVAGALDLVGALGGAVKGAVGSAASQGMLTGSIDPSEVLKSAAIAGGGAMIGDYAKDSLNDFIKDGVKTTQAGSDLGGMLGESGLLNKLGIPGTDQLLSTKPGSTFFDWYANNPVTSAVETALNPLLTSSAGQYALDALTSAMMRGYNEDWKDKRVFDPETQSWDWDGTETAEDIKNWARFNNAISGSNSIIQSFVENGGDIKGMWDLDEQYFYTNTDRDQDSIVSGILTRPIEDGGSPVVPTVATPDGTGDEQGGSGGEKGDEQGGSGDEQGGSGGEKGGTQSQASDSESNNGDRDANGSDGNGNQASAGGVAGFFDSNGNWAGTDEGIAFLNENGMIDPGANGDAKFIQQMIELIANADSDVDKQGLIDDYNNYVGGGSFDSTADVGDTTVDDTGLDPELPTNTTTSVVTSDDSVVIPPDDEDVLPPEVTGGPLPPDDDVVLPPDDDVVLPPTGGVTTEPPPLIDITLSSGGLPLLWDGLFPYKPFKGYTKDRRRLYEKMMDELGATGMFSRASGMGPMERELYEAGEFKR